MAEQQIEFVYCNIELYKSESLGSGSYGRVCKAKCDGLLCAAKIMHPTLFDLHDPGTVSYLCKFQEECHLLSLARHPNVVQYLATYSDPETRLPVLLMELCDESLTRFLERSPGPLPYHTQLNISHDIALALVYLHSNGLIHRDLTGNNVLMIAGTRAKVTDFGMSKLATVNPRMTALTLCPGNVLYMSPEALNEYPIYSDKLDVFSLGVLQVQIMTRQFPKPTERFQVIDDPRYPDPIRVPVHETQRRHAHLQLISDTHPLKPHALQCLKNKDSERPSAQQLSERLSELKLAPQYTQSMQQAQAGSRDGGREEADALRRQIQEQVVENGQLQRQLRAQIEKKNRELQEKEHTLTAKERELQQKQQQLQVSEQLVADFQQSVEQKDRTISDLQQTISAHERKIQQLEQQERATGGQPRQLPVTADTPQAATASAVEKDITKLRWREGKKTPEEMIRGAAVAHGNIAYFNPDDSHKVYSYQIMSGAEQWSSLPDNRYETFSLAVIDGLLTSVGGYKSGSSETNTLLSLTGEGKKRKWSEVFPPMPTARSGTAAISTEQFLVVAGGLHDGKNLDTVEVLNIKTKQWTTASFLPRAVSSLTGATCGDQLYLAGSYAGKSVLTCSLSDLLPHQSLGTSRRRSSRGASLRRSLSLTNKRGVWKEVRSLPVTGATLATLAGHLLAIGGDDDKYSRTAGIHRYDPHTDSWHVISLMNNKRCLCLAAVLPGDQLTVVGGWGHNGTKIDSVEMSEYM